MERRLKAAPRRPKAKRARRRPWLWLIGGVLLTAALLALAPVRHALLRTAGGLLIVSDAVAHADIGVMTESGQGGELELSDLYHEGVIPRVMVLTPADDEVSREFARRGVHREDLTVSTLMDLGVPRKAITTLDAGEGGTTESAQALATWAHGNPVRILLVIDPTHGRRYRRTLLRQWPEGTPLPAVTRPRANSFRAADWWQSRRTRRDGIIELARLAWDVALHPF